MLYSQSAQGVLLIHQGLEAGIKIPFTGEEVTWPSGHPHLRSVSPQAFSQVPPQSISLTPQAPRLAQVGPVPCMH